MKYLHFFLATMNIVYVHVAQAQQITFANDYFSSSTAKSTTSIQPVGNSVYGLTDDYTGEAVVFNKVTNWIDGSPIDDSKIDGIIYRKKGNDYYRRSFNVLTPEMFGAIGDAKNDDTEAFRKLFSIVRQMPNAAINAASGKTYKLTGAITLDYSGKGVVNNSFVFNGNDCRFFLAQGKNGNGWYGFNISTDIVPFQNTKFSFTNISFYCDNVNRPNAIKASGACFVTIDNCKFINLGEGVNFNFAGMSRINNCWAWGCVVGFSTNRSKDIYINECHAYGCDWGFRIEGVNNFGSDGNVTIANSVGNACKKYNLVMKGLYTPFISNCVFEMAPINISITSCNYGKMNNVFCGPGRFEFLKDPALLTNDFWNISNIDCQGLVTFNSLKFSNISNFKVSGVNGSNNTASTSIVFSDGYRNNVSALTVEGTKEDVKNAIVVNEDCNVFTWSGLLLDRPVLFRGNKKNNTHVMSSSIIKGDVVAEDGTFSNTSSFDYLNQQNGLTKTIKNGKLLP